MTRGDLNKGNPTRKDVTRGDLYESNRTRSEPNRGDPTRSDLTRLAARAHRHNSLRSVMKVLQTVNIKLARSLDQLIGLALIFPVSLDSF